MEQRALQRFESTITSKETRKKYRRHLDYFKKFVGAKDYDNIVSIPSDKIQELIEDYEPCFCT